MLVTVSCMCFDVDRGYKLCGTFSKFYLRANDEESGDLVMTNGNAIKCSTQEICRHRHERLVAGIPPVAIISSRASQILYVKEAPTRKSRNVQVVVNS